MASCRHHSGYLADDEAGHSTYVGRVQPPKKPLFSGMGPDSKLGREPHPPSIYGSSVLRSHHRNPRGAQPFGSFLDFLTEGQVLDSLQTVVEEATERMAVMKTEAGVPLVEVQNPVEVLRRDRRVRARPSLSTVRRHRARPSLCTGRSNNYPSCSSSMSDFHSSLTAGWLGSHSRDSDLVARGLSSLPPVRDKLLLEKNLKWLLQLENKGKGLNQSCSQRDSLLWDSLDSQTSSQWTREHPRSWFSGLLGSSSGTPEASELGPGEQELTFLKQGLNKEIKSLLNQPASFNLPAYCSLREPHRTLDFLAENHLFPSLQHVVSQAVDKLSGARRHNGCLLFPTKLEPNPGLPVNSDLLPGSKPATPTKKEPYDSLPTTASSPKLFHRKSKSRQDFPSSSSAQVATRFRPKSPNSKFTKKKPLPSISPKSSMSHLSNPGYEEFVSFLTEQAVSLLICKYEFEKDLNKHLGFISFPVTGVLVDLFLGFKKVKGSCIRLSSQIDWSCLLRKLEEAERAGQASQLSTSQRSMESPSTQPEQATNTHQDQATELGLSPYMGLPDIQLLSPQEPVTAEDQKPPSLSEPKLYMSSGTGMGSNPHKSKETVTIKDSKGSDEDEDSSEEENEDKSQSLPDPP
ncbi:coiled-coil domain-containing protein 116 [Cynocephalus volans]|uniref:coiled-coil domain-containing protein 116 n=1 Tax=Cynocephalus volans TaxID=110931 RepID=UPI002FC81588